MRAIPTTIAVFLFLTMTAAACFAQQPPAAQDASPPTVSAPATSPASTGTVAKPAQPTSPAPPAPESQSPPATVQSFWPALNWATITWFGAVVILTVTIRMRPVDWLRNLDGVVLAGMCILLGLRAQTTLAAGTETSWQWWAYIGLLITCGYWLLRGVSLMLTPRVVRHAGNVSSGARLVLVAVGLTLCVHHIVTAPLSRASYDGIVGGLCVADAGKLPYGEVPKYESQSPLLYLAHAPAVMAVEPMLFIPDDDVMESLSWDARSGWLDLPWQQEGDLTAARTLNAVLFALLVVGVYIIGARLHTAASAGTMVVILCAFPGTIECLPRPDIMLPAVLLTWTVAFALLPVVGGLLATVCLVLAGLAWPWAWLALPILLGYLWRSPLQAVGSVLGLGGTIALTIFGLLHLVEPSLPRSHGALQMAALQPVYVARAADDETIVLNRRTIDGEEIEAHAATFMLWRGLLRMDSVGLEDTDSPEGVVVDMPNGLAADGVLFRQVDAKGRRSLGMLREWYRASAARAPATQRAAIAARTIIEATWVPWTPRTTYEPSIWTELSGVSVLSPLWINIRRAVKIVVALLAVWGMLNLWLGKQPKPRHFAGAFLAVTAGTLIASDPGPITNLVWIVPLVTMLWAIHESTDERRPGGQKARLPVPAAGPQPAPPPQNTFTTPPASTSSTSPPFERGPAPRISLDADRPGDRGEST